MHHTGFAIFVYRHRRLSLPLDNLMANCMENHIIRHYIEDLQGSPDVRLFSHSGILRIISACSILHFPFTRFLYFRLLPPYMNAAILPCLNSADCFPVLSIFCQQKQLIVRPFPPETLLPSSVLWANPTPRWSSLVLTIALADTHYWLMSRTIRVSQVR